MSEPNKSHKFSPSKVLPFTVGSNIDVMVDHADTLGIHFIEPIMPA